MEEKLINEKESLDIITRMISNTQRNMEKNNGVPFLIWGYITILVSLSVWYLLSKTGNQSWNFLWFAIPLLGFPIMMLSFKKERKPVKTYIDKMISNIWIVLGIAAFVPSVAGMFMSGFPILFVIALLISIGTTQTGLVIKFKPLIVSGFLGIILSFFCLILKDSVSSLLVFAALFFVVQVIPGHILNYKGRH